MCFVREWTGGGGCPISELKLHKTPNSVMYQSENPKYTNAGIIALAYHKMMTMVFSVKRSITNRSPKNG